MTIMQEYRRTLHHGTLPLEYSSFMDSVKDASELEALLRVYSRPDAIQFMDKYSPLFNRHPVKLHNMKPSELPEAELAPLVAETINTALLMRFAIDAYRIATDTNAPLYDAMVELGIELYFNPEDDPYEPDLELSYMPPFILSAQEGLIGGQTTRINSDGTTSEGFSFYGYSDLEGNGNDAQRSALLDLVNDVFANAFADIKVTTRELKLSLVSESLFSFLWYQLLERLTSQEVRFCSMCQKPFLANTGEANERGGAAKAKTYCSDACRMLAYKARKAVKRIENDGYSLEKAAKAEHVSVQKLAFYIKHHPLETKEASNG